MKRFEKILSFGDLRSTGKNALVISRVRKEDDFDALFSLLFHRDTRIVMRAADAIAKITAQNFLLPG